MIPLRVVAVPETAPVKFAVYVPSPTFVVLPKVPVEVPPELPKVMVSPLVIRLFAASRAVRVATTALPEATLAADTAKVDVAREGAPLPTVTLGLPLVIALPLIFPDTVVAVPATTPVKLEV